MSRTIQKIRISVGHDSKISGYCYLNTRLKQYLWTSELIKETINVNHLQRFPEHDLKTNVEYYYEREVRG